MSSGAQSLMYVLWAVAICEAIILCALARRIFGLGSLLLAQVANDGLPLGSDGPNFEVTTQTGTTIKIGAMQSKSQVILFITPKCSSCRIAMMWMGEFLRSTEYSAVTVVSGDMSEVKLFADEYRFRYPLVPDSRDRIGLAYRVFSSPFVVILNPKGRVIGKGHVGGFQDIRDLFKIAQMRENMNTIGSSKESELALL